MGNEQVNIRAVSRKDRGREVVQENPYINFTVNETGEFNFIDYLNVKSGAALIIMKRLGKEYVTWLVKKNDGDLILQSRDIVSIL